MVIPCRWGITDSLQSSLQCLDEILRDFLDGLSAIDFRIDTGCLVVVDERLRRSLVYGKAILHRLCRVIRTLEELAAAHIADALFLRRVELRVIRSTALLACLLYTSNLR